MVVLLAAAVAVKGIFVAVAVAFAGGAAVVTQENQWGMQADRAVPSVVSARAAGARVLPVVVVLPSVIVVI